MIAAMPWLFSEYSAPLPLCFASVIPNCKPLRETSAMRQGAESLTCICGAGVAKLMSGEAKSNAIPNPAFMIHLLTEPAWGACSYLLKCNSALNWLTRAKILFSRTQPRMFPIGPRRSNRFLLQLVDLEQAKPLCLATGVRTARIFYGRTAGTACQ